MSEDAKRPDDVKRADFLPVPQKFNLALACHALYRCFGAGNLGVFHVGSSLSRRDYRDVDIRLMLSDAEFDRLFPSLKPTTTVDAAGNTQTQVPTPQLDATWSLVCASISLWLQHHSSLPVDFQIQRQTQANEEFKGKRNAIGMFYADPS